MRTPEMKCIDCREMTSVMVSGDNREVACFKTCDMCREKRRAYQNYDKMSYITLADVQPRDIKIETFDNDGDSEFTTSNVIISESSDEQHYTQSEDNNDTTLYRGWANIKRLVY